MYGEEFSKLNIVEVGSFFNVVRNLKGDKNVSFIFDPKLDLMDIYPKTFPLTITLIFNKEGEVKLAFAKFVDGEYYASFYHDKEETIYQEYNKRDESLRVFYNPRIFPLSTANSHIGLHNGWLYRCNCPYKDIFIDKKCLLDTKIGVGFFQTFYFRLKWYET